MSEKEEKLLLNYISTIKGLLSQILIQGKSQSEAILSLHKAGLEPKAISLALATTANTVSVTLSKAKVKK